MHAGETDAVIFEGSGCTGAVHKLVNAIRDFQVFTYHLFKKNMFFVHMKNKPLVIFIIIFPMNKILLKPDFTRLFTPEVDFNS